LVIAAERLFMVSESALRGYVLEEILARLLSRSGYRLLVEASQDADALKDGRHGLLVRGRGSDHQADALGELLIPTPFSLPLRLFVEAKFRGRPVGIADVRNALGVINDVNEHFASDAPRDFPLRRHHYRYVLFSASGFTEDAQKYALAHQISLIDLQGPAFADLRAITEQTTRDLLKLAEQADLVQFPLGQMRRVLRVALATWAPGGESSDTTFEGAYARSAQVQQVPDGEADYRLPAEALADIAAKLSEDLDDILILGFPQGPFVLVLQADDPAAFTQFLRDWQSAEIDVDIRYAPATADKPGEWAIAPLPERDDLVVRFGIPPLLESWLLAEDAAELERATQAERMLFSTITIFRDGNRALQLRYRKVRRYESSVDEVLTGPVPVLRRQLASPRLSFRGRQERDDIDLLSRVDEWYADPRETVYEDEQTRDMDQLAEAPRFREPQWTRRGLNELLDRLDEEQRVQADVIRMAAQQPDGRLPRALVYELGEYEDGRTLRGFIRPVDRITRQLQREGLVAADVAPALEPIYERGIQAAYFAVPADVRKLLTTTTGTSHPYGSGQKKNAIKGPDDFLTRVPGQEYRHALRHIFDTLADLDGMRIYWGTTGCSLRVAVPGRGPLSVGWLFPPDVPRWMGLTDLTLGWYKDAWYRDAEGINVSELGQAALDNYLEALSAFGGELRPDSGVIRGWTFRPPATTAYASELVQVIQTVVVQLRES
jgi:Restriction endonuclease